MPAFRFAHCSYSDATRRLPTHSRFHHSHHLNSRPLSLRFDLVHGLVIRSTVFRIMFIMPVFALMLTQSTFPQTNLLLRHSFYFYFYFYFEHLNFTWSYLIDMKISWSLDLISWSTILSLDLRSYLLIYDLILISWSYHLMMIQDMFLYMNFTLLLTCIQHAFDSCLSLMIDMHSTHVAVQHAFTLHLTCFGHTLYMCLPWGQHMDISI